MILRCLIVFVVALVAPGDSWEERGSYNVSKVGKTSNRGHHLFPIKLSSFEGLRMAGKEQWASEALADTINAYRESKGLKKVSISPYLTEVAELHVKDLEENNPSRDGCNLHSWSKSKRWSSCCYRPNNNKEACMWDKPREISQNRYTGNGYEIAAWSSHPMTPGYALDLWKKSKGHHDVIINSGPWSGVRWRSMGVAMSEHYAVVWFGEL